MITKTKTQTIISCNTPKCKSKLTVEGVRSNRKGYTLAISSDWRWKNAATHFCPAHKPANVVKAKVEKTEKKAEVSVATKVAPVKKVNKVTKKVVRLGNTTRPAAMVAKSTSKKTVK